MTGSPIDVGGVYAYAVLPPEQQWGPWSQPTTPFVPVYPPPVVTLETIRGLEMRIDALVSRVEGLAKHVGEVEATGHFDKRFDEFDRHFDQRCDALSVRLYALEAARAPTTEPEDCVVLSDWGMNAYRMTEAEARRYVSREPRKIPGLRIMRLVPLEPKP